MVYLLLISLSPWPLNDNLNFFTLHQNVLIPNFTDQNHFSCPPKVIFFPKQVAGTLFLRHPMIICYHSLRFATSPKIFFILNFLLSLNWTIFAAFPKIVCYSIIFPQTFFLSSKKLPHPNIFLPPPERTFCQDPEKLCCPQPKPNNQYLGMVILKNILKHMSWLQASNTSPTLNHQQLVGHQGLHIVFVQS